ncbi:hypothetical protein Bbelb_303810 [Branchiostoma belcheri]|nr:hypothetical protein Bbelb_303810 [Branchiostoma belcheri]
MCDHAFNDTATYNGAVRRCSSDGGTLAMPRDNATNNFLIDLKNAVDKNSYFRFGLTDVHQEGVGIWDDNVSLGDFRAWAQDNPTTQVTRTVPSTFPKAISTVTHGTMDRVLEPTSSSVKSLYQSPTKGQCWDPGVPANGIRDNNSNFTSGQTVRYTCMDGYWLLWGTANITCQPNGTWSGVPPTCEGHMSNMAPQRHSEYMPQESKLTLPYHGDKGSSVGQLVDPGVAHMVFDVKHDPIA